MTERTSGTEVRDFVLDLDAIFRIGGLVGDPEDDANTIEAVLKDAREKYGIRGLISSFS